MEQQLLKEENILPGQEVLNQALGIEAYQAYKIFIDTITAPPFALNPEWRYYHDGKAWLCKIQYKKKTILWLSVWNGFFKTSFFFTEKNKQGVFDLDISEKKKTDFTNSQAIGRLIPLICNINKKEQLEDLLKIVKYKQSLK